MKVSKKEARNSSTEIEALPKAHDGEDEKWLESLESVLEFALKNQGPQKTSRFLDSLMERLRDELMRRKASSLFVQGIAQAIAIHLARNYAEMVKEPSSGSPSLPGFKLRQITDWMAEHMTEEFNLDRLAAQAGLSKFHFHRLFKSATGVAPSQYHINLRMNLARRMLRETKKSVVAVALDVGYANPSHFARLFRRETGLSPSDYRRQR